MTDDFSNDERFDFLDNHIDQLGNVSQDELPLPVDSLELFETERQIVLLAIGTKTGEELHEAYQRLSPFKRKLVIAITEWAKESLIIATDDDAMEQVDPAIVETVAYVISQASLLVIEYIENIGDDDDDDQYEPI